MTELISLGSGCDAAMQIKRLKLSNTTHFFDYLWNYNDGMKSVIKIFNDNFEGFDTLSDYKYDYIRGIWGGKKVVIVNNKYKNIGFIHYDIFTQPKVLESFKRKVSRIRSALDSEDSINFVYYRSFRHTIESDYKQYSDFDVERKLEYFYRESENFVRFFSRRFQNKKFKLLSLFAEPVDSSTDIGEKIDLFFKGIPPRNNLEFGRVYERYNGKIGYTENIVQSWEKNTNDSWENELKRLHPF